MSKEFLICLKNYKITLYTLKIIIKKCVQTDNWTRDIKHNEHKVLTLNLTPLHLHVFILSKNIYIILYKYWACQSSLINKRRKVEGWWQIKIKSKTF